MKSYLTRYFESDWLCPCNHTLIEYQTEEVRQGIPAFPAPVQNLESDTHNCHTSCRKGSGLAEPNNSAHISPAGGSESDQARKGAKK